MGKRRQARQKKAKPWPLGLLGLAGAIGAFAVFLLMGDETPSIPAKNAANPHPVLPSIAPQVVAKAQQQRPKPLGPKAQGPVYVALRAGGLRQAEAWSDANPWEQGLTLAIQSALQDVPLDRVNAIDAVEICLTFGYFEADPASDQRPFSNVHRGVRGLELRYGSEVTRWSPTRLNAGNISFENAQRRFTREHSLAEDRLAGLVQMRFFEADQFLVSIQGGVNIEPMFRGNQVVDPGAVTWESVQQLARSMAAWMEHQVGDDGRMTYHYFPSRGTESNGNNMIRQFMASLCLARLNGSEFASSELEEKLFKNLAFNFQNFYRQDGPLGFVEFQGKAKLGAAALAALAILEGPFREAYAGQLQALAATVTHLQQEDGAFRTFYKPVDRNDNQNFYPGEALLFWAIQYTEAPDPALLRRIMRSFHHYRAWHRDPQNRNPAFVPWHTQAYALVWQKTKVPALAEFVFEMNDWLLALQQWDRVSYPDMRGRFYDPARPDYGPPHASSTGVYLEGLIDAFAMARQMGDVKRAEAYRRAIVKGLRSVMQLQFADEVDMYYVSKKVAVQGGLRTTVYDNRIRVDNVQHNLMAVLKILAHFKAEDYRLQ